MGPNGLAPAVDFSSDVSGASGYGSLFSQYGSAGFGAATTIFDAVSPFILSWMNNRYATQQQRRNNRYLQQLQRDQNAFNVRMLNQQNTYNSPREMVARLRAAGLNPNLAYGSLGQGMSQGLQSAGVGFDQGSAPRVPANTQTAMLYHNMKMQQYERDLAKEDIIGKRLQNEGMQLDNSKKENDLSYNDVKNKLDVAYMENLNTNFSHEWLNMAYNNSFLESHAIYLDAATNTEVQQCIAWLMENAFNEATLDERIRAVGLANDLTEQEIEESKKLIQYYIALTAKTWSEKKGIDLQNDITELFGEYEKAVDIITKSEGVEKLKAEVDNIEEDTRLASKRLATGVISSLLGIAGSFLVGRYTGRGKAYVSPPSTVRGMKLTSTQKKYNREKYNRIKNMTNKSTTFH